MVQKQRAPWHHCSACDYSRRDQFWNSTGIKEFAKKTQVRISAENAATKDKQRRFFIRFEQGFNLWVLSAERTKKSKFFSNPEILPKMQSHNFQPDEANGKHNFFLIPLKFDVYKTAYPGSALKPSFLHN